MKKIILIIIFTISGYLVWNYFSVPEFKGKHSALRKTLWEWKKSDNDEKFFLAEKISLYSAFRKLSKKENDNFSEDEENALEEAMIYLENLGKDISDFEDSLSREEIEIVTKANPSSIFRKLGRFYSNPAKAANCKFKDYEELRKDYSAEELYKIGINIGPLTQLMEEDFKISYAKSLIEILDSDPSRKSKYSTLRDFYYPSLVNPSEFTKKMTESFESNKNRRKQYRKDIIEFGISEEGVDEYISEMASKSPNCLLGINFSFVEHAKKGLMNERARKILDYLKEKSMSESSLPESIYDIEDEKIKPLYMEAPMSFFIKKLSDTSIELFSEGQDSQEGTADDISYGVLRI